MLDKENLERINETPSDKNPKFIKTGFKDLELTGVDNSALITIASRPCIGKTGFLISLLINLLRQKKKCLLFSLDLTIKTVVLRLISQMTEIETCVLRNNHNINSKYLKKIYSAFTEIADFDFYIDENSYNIKSIKKTIEKIKPDYVFIDYFQLIEPKSKKQCIVEAPHDILKDLKKIAQTNNSIIFIASQLSRKVEERNSKLPMLSDLRESSAIEQYADVVMFVHREEYYDKGNPEYKNKGKLIIAKNSYGNCRQIELQFLTECAKWKDI